jgi:hypothetical protein
LTHSIDTSVVVTVITWRSNTSILVFTYTSYSITSRNLTSSSRRDTSIDFVSVNATSPRDNSLIYTVGYTIVTGINRKTSRTSGITDTTTEITTRLSVEFTDFGGNIIRRSTTQIQIIETL